jgi:hypothetical protein
MRTLNNLQKLVGCGCGEEINDDDIPASASDVQNLGLSRHKHPRNRQSYEADDWIASTRTSTRKSS